jgi:hypothetical protein
VAGPITPEIGRATTRCFGRSKEGIASECDVLRWGRRREYPQRRTHSKVENVVEIVKSRFSNLEQIRLVLFVLVRGAAGTPVPR